MSNCCCEEKKRRKNRDEEGDSLFRKMRGIPLPYRVQGWIFFTCQCYDLLPKKRQRMIDDAISSACGSCPEALKVVLTSQRSVSSIAMEYYVSEPTLYRMRKQFYLEYWKMISTP